MADDSWYVHDDGIYGVSIDHDSRAGGQSYIPCSIRDINELEKQRNIVIKKIEYLNSSYKELGSKYVKIGIIVSILSFFIQGLLYDISSIISFLAFISFCIGIYIIIKGRRITKTLYNARNNSCKGLNNTNAQIFKEYDILARTIKGMNIQMIKLKEEQKLRNKGANRIVNNNITSDDLDRIKRGLEDIDNFYKQ